jgi:hypothetical protein
LQILYFYGRVFFMSNQNTVPNKKFFESDPRAALVRNITLEALNAARGVFNSGGQDRLAQDELIEANSRLTEIGITPNMHTIDRSDPSTVARQKAELMANPVQASEWLAGQVRDLVIQTGALSTAGGLEAKLSEHDELSGEVPGAALLRGDRLSIARDIGMVGILSSMVDYDAGPSDLEHL